VNAILIPSIHRVSSPDFINQTITWPVSDCSHCMLVLFTFSLLLTVLFLWQFYGIGSVSPK